MNYVIAHIADKLKDARKSKGLSQRALSQKTGIPQSHISKIEKGDVDLRLSSLIELARGLGLELTLVPRKTVPAVKSIARSGEPRDGAPDQGLRETRIALTRTALNILSVTVIRLIRKHPTIKELAQLQNRVYELQRLNMAVPDIEVLMTANKALRTIRDSTKALGVIRESLSNIKDLRNAMLHGSAKAPQIESVRPAYSLDEDDNG